MKWNTVAASLAAGVITIAVALAAPPPAAHAKNGDTHVTGQGIERTLDCNESTLLVNGTQNIVTALGTCWAVTVMGSSNTVVADTIINDITVYGWDETVFFRNGDPFIWDRGRELGMVKPTAAGRLRWSRNRCAPIALPTPGWRPLLWRWLPQRCRWPAAVPLPTRRQLPRRPRPPPPRQRRAARPRRRP